MKGDLLRPVFRVANSQRYGEYTPQAYCVVCYVRQETLTKKQIIERLTEQLRNDYRTQTVRFAFWSDWIVTSGGSPEVM